MIDRHDGPTPDGHTVATLFEELGLPRGSKPVNMGKGGTVNRPAVMREEDRRVLVGQTATTTQR